MTLRAQETELLSHPGSGVRSRPCAWVTWWLRQQMTPGSGACSGQRAQACLHADSPTGLSDTGSVRSPSWVHPKAVAGLPLEGSAAAGQRLCECPQGPAIRPTWEPRIPGLSHLRPGDVGSLEQTTSAETASLRSATLSTGGSRGAYTSSRPASPVPVPGPALQECGPRGRGRLLEPREPGQE